MSRRPAPAAALRRIGAALAVGAFTVVLAPLLQIPTTSGAFTAAIRHDSDTAASASAFTCPNSFAATGLKDQAYFEYALTTDPSISSEADQSTAGNDGAYRGTRLTDRSTPQACPATPGVAWSLNGSDSWMSTSKPMATSPSTFTEVVWFKTALAGTVNRGGFLMGVSQYQVAGDGPSDRFLYVDSTGRLAFGIYQGSARTLASGATVDDGAWHQAVVTVSASGTVLYLDGARVDQRSDVTGGEATTGTYWRLGWRAVSGSFRNAPANAYFAGSMRFAAAYRVAIDASEVAAQYRNGKP